MKNIYMYISEDDFLLEEAKKDFISKKDVDAFNISSYNFLTSDPLEILSELTTMSLLGDEKIVILTEPEFLKNTYKDEDIIDKFNKYFSNPNPDTTLLILSNFGLDSKSVINNTLKANSEIKVFDSITGDNLSTWIKEELDKEEYSIDPEALEELIIRTDGELKLIKNEIEKLKLYQQNKHINLKSVKLMVTRNLEDNIFTFLNAFISNDTKTLLDIYDDFMAVNEDEMRIISAIGNKLEEILYTKALIKQGLNKDQIAGYFKVKPGRAYYMMQNAKSMREDSIIDLIKRITDLDYKIKSGQIDKKLGLQLFILGA